MYYNKFSGDVLQEACGLQEEGKHKIPNVRITEIICLDKTFSDLKHSNIALEKAIVFFTAKFLN